MLKRQHLSGVLSRSSWAQPWQVPKRRPINTRMARTPISTRMAGIMPRRLQQGITPRHLEGTATTIRGPGIQGTATTEATKRSAEFRSEGNPQFFSCYAQAPVSPEYPTGAFF
jgi:hypothetical protein